MTEPRPVDSEAVVEITAVDLFSPVLRGTAAALDIVGDMRCGRTDLIRSQCAHCRPPAPVDEETAALRVRLYARGWFPSRYAGTCFGCAFPFPPDAAVRLVPGDGEDRFIAECCAKDGGDGGG